MTPTETLAATLITQAIKAGIVRTNKHGVCSFSISAELAAQFSFDRHGVCDGRFGDEGCFQVRKPTARRAAYVMYND